jgi:peroxiredoxin
MGRSPLVLLGLVVLTGASVLLGCSGPQAQPQAQVGNPAPDFSLATLDGKTIQLSSLRGKPVVVNFWASWCHFCVGEAPDLQALYQQYHGQGLEMLGVGTDDQEALRAKAQELKLTYPIGSNPQAADTYGVEGVPHTFFINRQGLIAASARGARSRADLEAEVKKLL